MAKVKILPGADAFSDFLRLIEEEAARFPVELIRLTEEKGCAPQGVLVLDNALAASRKRELEKRVTGEAGQPRTASSLTLPGRQDGQESFHGCVRAELARVKQSRLPCALLLIRFAGGGPPPFKKAVAALKIELQDSSRLAHYDHATYALLLPGLNRNRALHKARAIHQCLGAVASCQVKIGLAVCMARAVPEAEEFITMATRELHKSGHDTGGIFYSFQEEEEDSCQVTAEERAQLFRFGGEGKKRAL